MWIPWLSCKFLLKISRTVEKTDVFLAGPQKPVVTRASRHSKFLRSKSLSLISPLSLLRQSSTTIMASLLLNRPCSSALTRTTRMTVFLLNSNLGSSSCTNRTWSSFDEWKYTAVDTRDLVCGFTTWYTEIRARSTNILLESGRRKSRSRG